MTMTNYKNWWPNSFAEASGHGGRRWSRRQQWAWIDDVEHRATEAGARPWQWRWAGRRRRARVDDVRCATRERDRTRSQGGRRSKPAFLTPTSPQKWLPLLRVLCWERFFAPFGRAPKGTRAGLRTLPNRLLMRFSLIHFISRLGVPLNLMKKRHRCMDQRLTS
jgi:hypothetical protein